MSKLNHTAIAALSIWVAAGLAQTDARGGFDVTSVKLHPAGTRPATPQNPGFVSLRGITLLEAMQRAYKANRFQIEGEPAWASTDRFDMEGTMPGDSAATLTPDVKARQAEALRALLEDRLQLKLRRETRTVSMFHLNVAEPGLKVKEGEDLLPAAGARQRAGGVSRDRERAQAGEKLRD